MRFLSFLLVLVLGLGLSACSNSRVYNGPEVTRILVYKEERKMYLLHKTKVLKKYDIGLGFAPVGHKQYEGDGRTPEGTYRVDRRNPDSKFYLSVGISYPNVNDRAFASSQGKSPGGDIFIHGEPNVKQKQLSRDWTAGCIAVRNKDIEEIYAMVNDGTLITIYP
ncbi:L,D-transpeptidase family protein [Pseudooceanicola sp. C21-150M6]|uniref:L,D-transpeptidase family protein n=1 Tax=Pseudooceanicola sp. C21-150M6 TaxID=3434355 RepID=UPI003D7F8969